MQELENNDEYHRSILLLLNSPGAVVTDNDLPPLGVHRDLFNFWKCLESIYFFFFKCLGAKKEIK